MIWILIILKNGIWGNIIKVSKQAAWFRYGWKQACKTKVVVSTVCGHGNEIHTRLSRKKILIDIHNVSKHHFLRKSWTNDINFFNVEHYARWPDALSYWRPHPGKFSGHFTKTLPIQHWYHGFFVNFNKRGLKNSMRALVPPTGTKNHILGVLAHGLTALTS